MQHQSRNWRKPRLGWDKSAFCCVVKVEGICKYDSLVWRDGEREKRMETTQEPLSLLKERTYTNKTNNQARGGEIWKLQKFENVRQFIYTISTPYKLLHLEIPILINEKATIRWPAIQHLAYLQGCAHKLNPQKQCVEEEGGVNRKHSHVWIPHLVRQRKLIF